MLLLFAAAARASLSDAFFRCPALTPTYTLLDAANVTWQKWSDGSADFQNSSAFALAACGTDYPGVCLTPDTAIDAPPFAAATAALPLHPTPQTATQYGYYVLQYWFTYSPSGPNSQHGAGLTHFFALDGHANSAPWAPAFGHFSGAPNGTDNATDVTHPRIVTGRLALPYSLCVDFSLNTSTVPTCRYLDDPTHTTPLPNGTFYVTLFYGVWNNSSAIIGALVQQNVPNGVWFSTPSSDDPAWSVVPIQGGVKRLVLLSLQSIIAVDRLLLQYTLFDCAANATTTASTTASTTEGAAAATATSTTEGAPTTAATAPNSSATTAIASTAAAASNSSAPTAAVSANGSSTKLLAALALSLGVVLLCFFACFVCRRRLREGCLWRSLYFCVPRALRHCCFCGGKTDARPRADSALESAALPPPPPPFDGVDVATLRLPTTREYGALPAHAGRPAYDGVVHRQPAIYDRVMMPPRYDAALAPFE